MLHVKRLTEADGHANWVLYEGSKFARPVAILQDGEMDALLDAIDAERDEAVASQLQEEDTK